MVPQARCGVQGSHRGRHIQQNGTEEKMTRKLEELFGLQPNDTTINTQDPDWDLAHQDADVDQEVTSTEVTPMEEMQATLDLANKIEKALPQVKDVDSTDADFDEYAKKAMETYDRLVDLGMNVDDRNAGMIFDVASKMMTNAISAKNSKLDAKLRRIELQLKASKLQLDKDKFQSGKAPEGSGAVVEGEGYIVTDRNALLQGIVNKIKNDK